MLNRLQKVFASFQSHDVKYVVIGGIAAILHDVPSATFDLDILVEASPDNAKRLLDALVEAGMGTGAMTTSDELLANETTIFKDYVRLDLQTRTPGLEFAKAWERRDKMEYGGQRFFVVSRTDLIASKRAAGRAIDLDDVRLLESSESS